MLGASQLMAFVATTDAARAERSTDGAAELLHKAGGVTVRVRKVATGTPPGHTIDGWSVPDIHAAMKRLDAGGVRFESFGRAGRDEAGGWTASDGTRVARFKDPDGDLLSLTQF